MSQTQWYGIYIYRASASHYLLWIEVQWNSSSTCTFKEDSNDLSLLKLAFNYFEDYNPQRLEKDQTEEMLMNCKSCKHLTDLIRCFYLPKQVYDKSNKDKYCVLKTASNKVEWGKY
jgi:hypothetical protein